MSLDILGVEDINFAIKSLEAVGDSPGDVSDGYHTFGELYEHRNRLFAALLKAWDRILFPHMLKSNVTSLTISESMPVMDVWKSKLHYDGSTYEGYFIAGIETIHGQITYHLPVKLWDELSIKTLDRGREWDGHTPDDVLERLLKL